MHRNVSNRTKKMMMAVLPPLDSENSDCEEDLEYPVPIPKIDSSHLSDSDPDCDSNIDTSDALTVQDLEEMIGNLDDLPIYDDAGG